MSTFFFTNKLNDFNTLRDSWPKPLITNGNKMKLIFNIMSVVSFVGILFLSSVLVYSNVTKDKRLLKNRKFMEKVIEQQVNIQIRESMPNQSGGVNVGNTEN